MRISYLLFFLHKVSRYLLLLILVASVTFHVALWHNLSPDYFERLRTQLSSFLHQLSFLRENKVIFEFNIYFCYIHIAVFTRLSLGVVCGAFLLRG